MFSQILLELGKKLEPGSGEGEFCKPTSVAVLPSGEFFVADGYCNSRIIKYTKAGMKISEWKAGKYLDNRFSLFLILITCLKTVNRYDESHECSPFANIGA